MKNRCRLKNHSFEHRDKSKKSIQFAVLLAVIILASKVLVGCAHVASTDPFSKGLDNAISVSGFTVKSPGAIQILLKNVSNEAWMLEIPDMIAFSLTWKEANPDSVMLLGQTRWGGGF